jgi:hypothetical protein
MNLERIDPEFWLNHHVPVMINASALRNFEGVRGRWRDRGPRGDTGGSGAPDHRCSRPSSSLCLRRSPPNVGAGLLASTAPPISHPRPHASPPGPPFHRATGLEETDLAVAASDPDCPPCYVVAVVDGRRDAILKRSAEGVSHMSLVGVLLVLQSAVTDRGAVLGVLLGRH